MELAAKGAVTELPVYDEHRGGFAALTGRRVLIYWPHGLGDFVHLAYVLPLLEPSNEYFLTRFGDDFVHLYDTAAIAHPIYSGERRIGAGSPPHFGVNFKKIRNRVERLTIPEPLRSRIESARIDTVLYTDYPEKTGRVAYPFHTKARYIIGKLVAPERLAQFDLSQPLQPGIPFTAPDASRRLVEDRLRAAVEPGDRLYLISPGGHTQLDKIWPEASVAEFARLVRARDARARVVVIDERTSDAIGREPGLAPTTADLFAGLDVPFAHLLTTLIRASHAYAGVSSGPLHCAIAIGGRPTAGIWLAHWPEYYDEPSEAVHLVGPNVYRKKLDQRIGAYTKKQAPALRYRIVPFRERMPAAADVLDALDSA
jgi:hypothetical protein